MTTQDGFDIREFLPYLLNQAAEASGHGFQQYYKARYGMLRTEWRVVFHLGRYGDMTAKEICDRASLHKTKVSRAVAALENRRFLSRQPVETDKRHEMLSLTKLGQTAFRDLSGEARRFNETLMKPFSDAERDVLMRCLLEISEGRRTVATKSWTGQQARRSGRLT